MTKQRQLHLKVFAQQVERRERTDVALGDEQRVVQQLAERVTRRRRRRCSSSSSSSSRCRWCIRLQLRHNALHKRRRQAAVVQVGDHVAIELRRALTRLIEIDRVDDDGAQQQQRCRLVLGEQRRRVTRKLSRHERAARTARLDLRRKPSSRPPINPTTRKTNTQLFAASHCNTARLCGDR